MKRLPKILFLILSILFLVYLSLPSPEFPKPLWDFKSSNEPADKESDLRRGYYTNTTRDQLMDHYKKEFSWGINLNYPPEEAQTFVRDQTKSSFLEEIVHPMKESIFINGYRPKSDQEILEIEGNRYDSKVIIKYVGSNLPLRLIIGILTIIITWILINEWVRSIKLLKWISQ